MFSIPLRFRRAATSAALLATGALWMACTKEPTAPIQSVPVLLIEAASAISQEGVVSRSARVPPSVRVKGLDGNGVSGVDVTFRVVYGGGWLIDSIATTNELGIAAAGSWILGRLPGNNLVYASAVGIPGFPIAFSANALRAGSIELEVLALGGDAEFAFWDAENPYDHDYPTVQTILGRGTATIDNLGPGTYRISQIDPARWPGGWQFTSMRCSEGVSVSGSNAVVVLTSAVPTATCTWTNTKQ